MRAIERTLLIVASVCLSWYGWRMLEISQKQKEAAAQVQQALSHERDIALPGDGVIGRLEIPRLHVSAPVKTGDDDNVLDFSVGYLPDTPLPWMPGNSAFAAHRDRLFRPLEHIRSGDEIDLTTPHGRLRYRVLKSFVVNPRDVWVLDQIPRVSLTLITCYPFVYVGHAPHRFVVQAEKL
jgi:sortase A